MNPGSPNHDPLDGLLKSWRVDAALPPDFQRNVWARIDCSRGTPSVSVWQLAATWLGNVFARPAVATSYAAVLLVIGVSVGWGHAQQNNARIKDELRERYVQALDPYLSSHH
jgi:hypothetical protein